LRLFVPESWTSNPVRMKRAGVPVEHRAARSKPEIALAEIDRVIAAGVRFGCVLADAGYGLSAPFRQGLTARGLVWAVGFPGRQKVYPVGVKLIFPVAGRGRPRQRHIPDLLSMPAEDMLADARWKNVSWRLGTKGRLKARFAAVRVRIADGPPQRIKDMGQQHLPGEEAWLIGEHRSSGEKKYYLANLPAKTDLRTLAATIKARWICEQAHQQLKEELGLDHFEGRSWQGLHRHALMTMIAYAFLQHRRLAQAGRKKKNQRPSASADLAGRAPRHRRTHHSTTASEMPILQKTNRRKEAALLARPSSLLSQPALFSVSLVCQRLVGQFALRTFKRAQIGTSKAALDTDQHHANLALGAARPLDHARGMRFRHVMHSLGSGGSATLSVTDNSRRRGGDQISYTGNMSGS